MERLSTQGLTIGRWHTSRRRGWHAFRGCNEAYEAIGFHCITAMIFHPAIAANARRGRPGRRLTRTVGRSSRRRTSPLSPQPPRRVGHRHKRPLASPPNIYNSAAICTFSHEHRGGVHRPGRKELSMKLHA